MIHVCINSIAYLCNFILLFLLFSYIYLYNFFYKTTLCKNSAWFLAKESKLSSGLSQTPYNGFVIHLIKTNILRVLHKQCINTSLLQPPVSLKQFRLTCSTLLEKIRFNIYFFKVPTRPAMKNNTFRIRFFIIFDLGSNFCFIWNHNLFVPKYSNNRAMLGKRTTHISMM